MDILILIRNILVPFAIGMWVIIGLVAMLVLLKNKLGGKIKPTNGNSYKQTFVQGYNPNTVRSDSDDTKQEALNNEQLNDRAVLEALNATKALNKESSNSDNNSNNYNNTNKTNLCL